MNVCACEVCSSVCVGEPLPHPGTRTAHVYKVLSTESCLLTGEGIIRPCKTMPGQYSCCRCPKNHEGGNYFPTGKVFLFNKEMNIRIFNH